MYIEAISSESKVFSKILSRRSLCDFDPVLLLRNSLQKRTECCCWSVSVTALNKSG